MGFIKLMRLENKINTQLKLINVKIFMREDVKDDLIKLKLMSKEAAREIEKLQAYTNHINQISQRTQNVIDRKVQPILNKGG